ncbi:ABC transporter substrate-binding protein [Haloechinothrix sp. YIM 98757]|uniref:ABC transporter substrate-binding protein n=1 Tax=Haloechinothrix aidingensis TaxID=2752311 RepID=A0A838AGG3_9PSEU|nr:ABC transporter substrate-binding protein [Haloechinothrix aidingensis]MBA0128187.1 ABC transporter substrate-binding protein [Haloechinothrix aidingensis]
MAALVAATALVVTACADDNGDGADTGEDSAEPLELGYVLPETGDLAFLGPPQIEALGFAMQTINDAGGVLDQELPSVVGRDESDQESVASQSADEVLREGVDALIGAASSAKSLAFVDRVMDAGVVQCSGSNTAPTFTDLENGDFYFRTAPSDVMQGPVLADTIVGDGHSRVALAARADDYGRGLLQATENSLEEAGAEVVNTTTYDPKSTNFDPVVSDLTNGDPDAVVIVSFEEGVQVLQGLIEGGFGPDEIGIYGADGLKEENLGELVSSEDPGVLEGMKGTAPAAPEDEQFQEDLQEYAPDLEGFQFSPQVYDCVITIALAAEAAGSTDPADIQQEMVGVTRDGTECTSFEECKGLLSDGDDIDYNGVSGPLDFTENGEPSTSTIGIYEVDEEGTTADVDQETVTMEEAE